MKTQTPNLNLHKKSFFTLLGRDFLRAEGHTKEKKLLLNKFPIFFLLNNKFPI